MAERLRLQPSARLRILGWLLVLTALAVVGALLLSRRILLRQLDREVNEQLEQEAGEVRQLVGGRDPATGQPFGADVAAIFNTFLRNNTPAEGEAFYTFVGGHFHLATQAPAGGAGSDGSTGVPAAGPADLGDHPRAGQRWARLVEPAHGELATSAGPVRWLALPLHDRGGQALGVFVVANFLQDERQEINDAIETGLLMAAIVLVVAAMVGWVVAGRILHPIRQVSETAQAIGESDLSRRIEVEGRDEVAELARTFNAMLDRLESAFATQRAFVDDAGHELRTPITIVRGHLELLGDDPDERRETVALLTDELDRMSRIVDDLLVLAKLEHPDFLRPAPVQVGPFTRDLFAKAGALAALDGRSWRLAEVAEATVVADPQRLTQAIMNLVRNAGEHTDPGGTVTLGSTAGPGGVAFWVADTGSGIAVEEQARIFERFVRGGDRRRRSDGAGLGLAIVRAVAEAHGGRVEVASRPGAGSRFTITLPIRTGPEPAAGQTGTLPVVPAGGWVRDVRAGGVGVAARRTGRAPAPGPNPSGGPLPRPPHPDPDPTEVLPVAGSTPAAGSTPTEQTPSIEQTTEMSPTSEMTQTTETTEKTWPAS